MTYEEAIEAKEMFSRVEQRDYTCEDCVAYVLCPMPTAVKCPPKYCRFLEVVSEKEVVSVFLKARETKSPK